MISEVLQLDNEEEQKNYNFIQLYRDTIPAFDLSFFHIKYKDSLSIFKVNCVI